MYTVKSLFGGSLTLSDYDGKVYQKVYTLPERGVCYKDVPRKSHLSHKATFKKKLEAMII